MHGCRDKEASVEFQTKQKNAKTKEKAMEETMKGTNLTDWIGCCTRDREPDVEFQTKSNANGFLHFSMCGFILYTFTPIKEENMKFSSIFIFLLCGSTTFL